MATVGVAGTCESTSVVSANIILWALGGTCAATSAFDANLSRIFSGQFDGTAALTGDVICSRKIRAILPTTSTLAANLLCLVRLSGTIAARMTTQTRYLSGTIAGTSSFSDIYRMYFRTTWDNKMPGLWEEVAEGGSLPVDDSFFYVDEDQIDVMGENIYTSGLASSSDSWSDQLPTSEDSWS